MIDLMYQGFALFGLSRLVCQTPQTKPFEIRDLYETKVGLYQLGWGCTRLIFCNLLQYCYNGNQKGLA